MRKPGVEEQWPAPLIRWIVIALTVGQVCVFIIFVSHAIVGWNTSTRWSPTVAWVTCSLLGLWFLRCWLPDILADGLARFRVPADQRAPFVHSFGLLLMYAQWHAFNLVALAVWLSAYLPVYIFRPLMAVLTIGGAWCYPVAGRFITDLERYHYQRKHRPHIPPSLSPPPEEPT
jgi:hypothetical protein